MLVGREAQAKFRASWAAKEVEKVRTSSSKCTSWSTVDHTHGTYLSFGAIVLKEGGWQDPSAIMAAARYCRKAQLMSGGWQLWNSMTDRFDFLYIEKSFSQDIGGKTSSV